MANKDFKVKNGIDIQSPLPVSMGGTGQTTTGNTLNALLPSQAGNSNKVLSTDGSNTTWVAQSVAYQRGGTASRPASPAVGDLYYNTDYNYFESYTNNGWFPIAAAPSAPTGVTATNQPTSRAYNNGQASVAFTPNTSGGAPTSFILTPTPTTSPATFTGSSSPIVATGLASSTQYTYTVQATSPYGTSSASSASSGITATTVPQNPTVNSVTSSNGNSAIITFTAGATGGSAITQYTITSSPSTTTQNTSSSPYTFTGLTLGTSYTFNITATNANGTSTATTSSSVTIEPADSGAMFPLGVVTVGSGGSSYVEFTSIPATYTHLQVRIIARSNYAGDSDYMILTLPSSGTYYHQLYGDGSSAGAVGSNYIKLVTLMPGATATSSVFGYAVVDILDYTNTNKTKTMRSLNGYDANGSGRLGLYSANIDTLSAITTLRFASDNSSTFAQYSQFALYGIKGA